MDIDWNHDESGVKPQLTAHFEIVAEHLKDKLSESITVNRPVIKGTYTKWNDMRGDFIRFYRTIESKIKIHIDGVMGKWCDAKPRSRRHRSS